MGIKFYIGGHRRTSQHFTTVLNENNEYLQFENIAFMPSTRRTLSRISEALDLIKAGNDIEEVQAELLDRLSLEMPAKRLLILDIKLIGSSKRSFSDTFYNERVNSLFKKLRVLFKDHKLRLYTETRSLKLLQRPHMRRALQAGVFRTLRLFYQKTT